MSRRLTDRGRTAVAAALLTTTVVVASPAGAAPQAGTRSPARAPATKFERVEPSRAGDRHPPAAPAGPNGPVLAATTAVDTTAPGAPGVPAASARSLIGISATWTAAQDPESGIDSYAFAIGTNPTGDATALANTRWWQIANGTSAAVSIALDPALTYYVSVYAINGAGIAGPVATSAAVRPAWSRLGATTNALTVAFATIGYDTGGAPTTGWSAAQVATMSAFAARMLPIITARYGPPAESYTVTIVRDLRYARSNVFIPSTDEIRMDDTFSPQLLTHELLHAYRSDFLLSSDALWDYDPTLSGFEEAFAQSVSYEAMNQYATTYPTDPVVPANGLWGSSMEWDYDVQNVPELRGTDFWSDGGGTGIYWNRYEVGAAAMRKIEIESPGFARRFNAEYYGRLNTAPTTTHPTRALVVDIVASLVPTIEGVAAASWIDQQHVFWARNVLGEKIFHRIQDYPWTELYAFHSMYFTDTMACGSEWACWDGTAWRYHRLNGAVGTGTVTDGAGATVWTGPLQITPTTNPADGYMAFGSATKGLTTARSLSPWPGGSTADYVMGLTTLGLYRFDTAFTDPGTGAVTSNRFFRVLGSAVAGGFGGVYGGVIGHPTGTITIDHDGYPAEPPIAVTNGAFAATRLWTGIPNARTGGRDSVPGGVTITFTDAGTGAIYRVRRNIDTGSSTGSQMFMLDLGPDQLLDRTAPTVAVTSPATGATVSGTTTVSATAQDDIGVTRVEFAVDGTRIASVASAPFTAAWDTRPLALGNHTVTATAYDAAGHSTTAASAVVIADVTPPTVTITAPAPKATVGGLLTVTADATDDRAIGRVEFSVDGRLLVTDTAAPYSFVWSADAVTLGAHTIGARAVDPAGRATSTSIAVTVADLTPPTVALTAPAPNALVTVGTKVTIGASATDNRKVARVEFWVDGVLKLKDTTAPYSYVWTVPTPKGVKHTVLARAVDAANRAADASVVVTAN